MRKQLLFVILAGIFLLAGGSVCAQQYWTGNGGSGMSIAVLTPEGKGLAKGETLIPTTVQSVLARNLTVFSAMKVVDPEALEKIAVVNEGLDPDDKMGLIQLSKIPELLASAKYTLVGRVQKTGTNFNLNFNIIETANGTSKASHTGTCTSSEIENQIAVKKASADLLAQMGVTLNEAGRTALLRPADVAQIQGQAALSKGVEAARQGTEIAAQIYYFQAAALDPSLLEATRRSSVISANISSGNIGADTRNDIAWRKNWITRLTEFEETYYRMIKSGDPPYTLFYSTGIDRGSIDYQSETIDLSIPINMRANGSWIASVAQAGNAVYTELSAALNSTGRKNDWGLGSWPRSGVTGTNPFTSWTYDFSIVFELVNERNRVIGRRTINTRRYFSVSRDNDRVVTEWTENSFDTVYFNAVKANDISDNLTIRIASVNGADPKNAKFPMTALPAAKWNEYRKNNDTFRIENGILRGCSSTGVSSIPADIWGEPITSIGDSAFKNKKVIDVKISDGITSIGAQAFADNYLHYVVIPDSVNFIGEEAFSFFYYEPYGFELAEMKRLGMNNIEKLITTTIIIGSFVSIKQNSFQVRVVNARNYVDKDGFFKLYLKNGAGIYTYKSNRGGWKYTPR